MAFIGGVGERGEFERRIVFVREDGTTNGIQVGRVALQTGDLLAVRADGPNILLVWWFEITHAGVAAVRVVEEVVCGWGRGRAQEGRLWLRRERG